MSLVKDQGCYVYVGVMGHGIENLEFRLKVAARVKFLQKSFE